MSATVLNRRRLLVAAMAALPLSAASSEGASADFSDATIRWVIPFKSGGGSDAWARFVAPFLERYLPGQPKVEIHNEPGGGSTRAANRFAMSAPADGRLILGTSASTQFSYLLNDPRARYDYRRWRALLVYQTGGVVYGDPATFPDGAESLFGAPADARLIYGSQGATSIDLVPMLSFRLLGLDVRTIFGVRGRGAGRIAFERGDTTLDFQTTAAYLRNVVPLVEEGRARPLYSLGRIDETGTLARDPAFPDLPHFAELLKTRLGRAPAGVEWESWLAFLTAGFSAQKFIVVPEQTSAAIVAAYHHALQRMTQDPEYQAQKAEVLGVYDHFTGAQAERLYELSTEVPERSRSYVKAWLRSAYGLNL